MKKIILLGLLLTVTSAMQAQSKSDFALQKARKVIEASNAIYADLANKNDGSILSRYTADECLFPPNFVPVCGGEGIGGFFENGPKVQVTFTIQHLYGDAREFVTEESFYEMTDLSGNKIDDGKIIVVWKKTAAGWKMYRDMFSSNRAVSGYVQSSNLTVKN